MSITRFRTYVYKIQLECITELIFIIIQICYVSPLRVIYKLQIYFIIEIWRGVEQKKKNEETYMAIDMNMQYVGICSAFHSRYRRAESNYYIDDIYIILEKNEQNFQKILHSEHSKNWMTINQSCFVLFSFRCVFCVI